MNSFLWWCSHIKLQIYVKMIKGATVKNVYKTLTVLLCARSPTILWHPISAEHSSGKKWPTTLLAIKRSAGVTPKKNLRKWISCTPPPSVNNTVHSGFETQKTSQEVQNRGSFGFINGHETTKSFYELRYLVQSVGEGVNRLGEHTVWPGVQPRHAFKQHVHAVPVT